MKNMNKTTRTVLRWTHLLVGFLIGVYVYTPARNDEAFVLFMQAAVFPGVTLTGLWMWQQARIRRLYRHLRGNPQRAVTNEPKPTEQARRRDPQRERPPVRPPVTPPITPP